MDNKQEILRLLRSVADGTTAPEDALLELKESPFEDLGYAKVDFHRSVRQGAAEVIYGAGKTPEQIAGIVSAMGERGCRNILITRMDAEKAAIVSAGVELEAHRRAQGVLDQANSQARHLRQQMEQWMTRVGREYDALRTEVEATISHAADQLDKAGKCLEQVSALLSDQDVALEELSRAYDSTAPDKVPAPVPLEEEP